ncbi:hypothetical protein DSO57_1035151 [Entomophthora muscae]|uniref:Uncharacterized protein n=1 Tax=Entomophthora muscae TaxID=34485 RepID=A0ACC2SZX4_9FUNG|nr:hypothetical protein DSO57_1035151 [Entomophthora muscae]
MTNKSLLLNKANLYQASRSESRTKSSEKRQLECESLGLSCFPVCALCRALEVGNLVQVHMSHHVQLESVVVHEVCCWGVKGHVRWDTETEFLVGAGEFFHGACLSQVLYLAYDHESIILEHKSCQEVLFEGVPIFVRVLFVPFVTPGASVMGQTNGNLRNSKLLWALHLSQLALGRLDPCSSIVVVGPAKGSKAALQSLCAT